MKIYFSPENKGFYHEGIQENMPKDVVEVSPEAYQDFQKNTAKGKAWEFSEGEFSFSEKSALVNEPSLERSWRNYELRRADIEIYKIQDGNKTGISLADWRAYRNELRDWPNNPKFPLIDHRPISPDIKGK